jgi:hypothetical protein
MDTPGRNRSMAERIGSARVRYRGSLFHVVEIEIGENGRVSGKVLQAFEPDPGRARLRF